MRGARIARIGGVDVVADGSVFFLAALLTWAIYIDLDQSFPETGSSWLAVLSLGGGLAFIGSVLAHELSHSLLAIRRGLVVRRILLFVFGGVSEIVEEPRSPNEELAISIAGPVASAALSLILFAAYAVTTQGPARRLIWILALANLALAFFNLLPGLPLDGGRVLHAILWRAWGDQERAFGWAVRAGQVMGLVVGAVGLGILLAGGDVGGLWLVAIGWFLSRAASAARDRQKLAGQVSGLTAGDVMRPVDVAIAGDLTVEEALEQHGFGSKIRTFPVDVAGRVRGLLGNPEVEPIDAGSYRFTLVASVMSEIGAEDVVDRTTPLEALVARPGGPSRRAVVVEENTVVGIVTPDELAAVFGPGT